MHFNLLYNSERQVIATKCSFLGTIIAMQTIRQRTNRQGTPKEGDQQPVRRDEIEKLKEKGIVGGFLHLTTLVFNFYALASCLVALTDYVKGTHGDQDVDLFKTILPQLLAVLTGILVSPIAMRVINKTYEDSANICSDSTQAHKCVSQILKCLFNVTLFSLIYHMQYSFTTEEVHGSGGHLSIVASLSLGFALYLFTVFYRNYVVGGTPKLQKEKSMYNPYQAFTSHSSALINLSLVCKTIQSCIILPICDELLFRVFFYHRINTLLHNQKNNQYTPYLHGSRKGDLLVALLTSLLFDAYNGDKKINKKDYLKSIIPGVAKGLVLHLVLFSSADSKGIGFNGNLLDCIIIHSFCNLLCCLEVIYRRQFWLWP